MNKEIKILVACHKEDPQIRNGGIYFPIQVGKDLHPDIDLGFQCDNTGDNISAKIGSYCELTALYWAWKNLKNVDIIGLAHYRRYLDVNEARILNILSKNDIILPKPVIFPYSNYTHLCIETTREDVFILLKLIQKYYPDVFPSTFNYLFQNNRWYQGNIFITQYEIFKEYCEWLFDVLDLVKIHVKESPYFRGKRLLGYFGEVLLPIFVSYKKLGYDLYKIMGSVKSQGLIRNIRNELSYFIACYSPKNKYHKFVVPDDTLNSFKVDDIEIGTI